MPHLHPFDTDQGNQFTSARFIDVLEEAGIQLSMDGRPLDDVFIERPWRSLEYECVYLHAFETGSELRASLDRRIGCHHAGRPRSSLAGRTPDEAYQAAATEKLAARYQPEPSLFQPPNCPADRDHL